MARPPGRHGYRRRLEDRPVANGQDQIRREFPDDGEAVAGIAVRQRTHGHAAMAPDLTERQVANPIVRQLGALDQREYQVVRHQLLCHAKLATRKWLARVLRRRADPRAQANKHVV
jgi:hypothetical protein